MNQKLEETSTMTNRMINTLQASGTGASSAPEPEMALWVAVLNQAVKDTRALVQKVEKDPNLWANPMFRSEVLHLKRYFRKRSMEPGGFGFICDLLGVDDGQAARQVEKLYLRHLNRPVEQRPSRVAMLLAI